MRGSEDAMGKCFGFLAILAAFAAGCGGKTLASPDAAADTAADTATVGCASCTVSQYCDAATSTCKDRVDEATAATQRSGCTFAAGDKADRTIGKEWPVGDAIPIRHFVIVMMENRSFDSYFGAGKQFGLDVDGFPDGASNPDANGNAVPIFHTATACIADVDHSWTGTHNEVDGGKMDGFVKANDVYDATGKLTVSGDRAMGYFDGSDLLFYYGAAKTFGISDNNHCSALGPTWINRLFFSSGTSFGLTANKLPALDVMESHPDQLILAQLDKAGADWRIYKTDLTIMQLYADYMSVDANAARLVDVSQFFTDAAAGNLPAVSFIEPRLAASGGDANQNDEHPPGTPYQGEQFTHQIITALMASPNWKDSAYIQTYDEHGGFYDHAVPPAACKPDDMAPQLAPNDTVAEFDQMGMRVPLLVISPWSKPGYVSHIATENTSILRLLEARFGMGAMTARDANAWPLLDFFDFSQQPFLTPPTLPEPKLMTDVIAACVKEF